MYYIFDIWFYIIIVKYTEIIFYNKIIFIWFYPIYFWMIDTYLKIHYYNMWFSTHKSATVVIENKLKYSITFQSKLTILNWVFDVKSVI
jgi:hypothetical protein